MTLRHGPATFNFHAPLAAPAPDPVRPGLETLAQRHNRQPGRARHNLKPGIDARHQNTSHPSPLEKHHEPVVQGRFTARAQPNVAAFRMPGAGPQID
jgi:hypothetical protein